jgi:hypothetical protein
MVKWADLARPKDFGGLGFTDTRLMNKYLLSKWLIKLERGDVDLCTKLLRNKYLKDKGFFYSNARGGHSSGKACMMLNTFVRVGSNMC